MRRSNNILMKDITEGDMIFIKREIVIDGYDSKNIPAGTLARVKFLKLAPWGPVYLIGLEWEGHLTVRYWTSVRKKIIIKDG